jgi:tRNA-specific adenosine deaminase 3
MVRIPERLLTSGVHSVLGRYTVLDHYTFKWRDGRMALALGLGSLFNHSETPNVSYILDAFTDSIRYITAKLIEPGDEMCIFYGHTLWFDPVSSSQPCQVLNEENDDQWGGLTGISDDVDVGHFPDSDADEIIPVEDLPFIRVKVARDEDEEEDLSTVRTSKLQCFFFNPSKYNNRHSQ